MDYVPAYEKFMVIKTIEVPKSEYTYDNAINKILELNDIYNPSWIYVDRGEGEYQLERLHILGEKMPHTGLKNKVKGFQFKQSLDIMNPITKEIDRKPMKPFMVSQLEILFERERIILSPYDELLIEQLTDYEVVRLSANGSPIYSSDNDHFVDAFGLAYLAMVLEFSELTDSIKKVENTSKINHGRSNVFGRRAENAIRSSEMSEGFRNLSSATRDDPREHKDDKPYWTKTSRTVRRAGGRSQWGSRSRRGAVRSSW